MNHEGKIIVNIHTAFIFAHFCIDCKKHYKLSRPCPHDFIQRFLQKAGLLSFKARIQMYKTSFVFNGTKSIRY